jgi:hypothetical protein
MKENGYGREEKAYMWGYPAGVLYSGFSVSYEHLTSFSTGRICV